MENSSYEVVNLVSEVRTNHGKFCLKFAASWRDVRFTAFSIGFMLVCLYVVCVCNGIADRQDMNSNPNNKKIFLPDLLLQRSYHWFLGTRIPHNLSDILVVTAVVLTIIRIFLTIERAATAFRRSFLTIGVLYFARAFTVLATSLPNPLPDCRPDPPHPNILIDGFWIFVGAKRTCGDVFFSGHSILFTLASLVWNTYQVNCLCRRSCYVFFRSI